jgi:hypothetical protein
MESDFIDTEEFYHVEAVTEPISETSRESRLIQASASAQSYNSHLKSLRNKPFYDVHTGNYHYPTRVQIHHVDIEMKRGGGEDLLVDELVTVKGASSVNGIGRIDDGDSKRWRTLVPSLATKRNAEAFPLAIMPGQKRMTVSLYRERFNHDDALRSREIATNPIAQKEEVEESSEEEEIDLPVITLCSGKNVNGTHCKNRVPVSGDYCIRHAEVEANKVKRKELCCHCLKKEAPVAFEGSSGLPDDLVLDCSSCNLKHHPACLGI